LRFRIVLNNKFKNLSEYINKLIDEGEHLKQDFKFEISDVRKIAKTLVAFSNTMGGKLLVGVKDNGKISGIKSDEEIYMIDAAASLYCKPEVSFTINKWNIFGKTILEIDIPKGDKKPYLAKSNEGKWLAYIRVKDENFLVNAIQLKVWKNENRNKGVFLPFTDKEKILLEYLQTNNSISLDTFCKIASVNRKKASDTLVRLISIDELEIVYSGDSIEYKLRH
jgi:predicted HTH transcriptional regulator